MLRPATPLSVLLFAAFALLLMAVLSTPIIKAIPLASFLDVNFGVFGFCRPGGCSAIEVSYDTSTIFPIDESSSFDLPTGARTTLSTILIIHPVAAFLTLVMLILAVAAHLHSPSHSARYLLIVFVVGIIDFVVCLLSFLVDVLLFVPHMAWGSYLVLAATILVALSGIVACAMRRVVVNRKARRKRIADNAEMSGQNYYGQQVPQPMPPPPSAALFADLNRQPTVPVLSCTNDGSDEIPQYATFERKDDRSSDERVPLTSPITQANDNNINNRQPDETPEYGPPFSHSTPPGPGAPVAMPHDQFAQDPYRQDQQHYGLDPYGLGAPPPAPYGLSNQPSNETMSSRGRGGMPPANFRGRGGMGPPGRGGYGLYGSPTNGRGGGGYPGGRGGYGPPRGGAYGPPPPGHFRGGRGGYGPPPRGHGGRMRGARTPPPGYRNGPGPMPGHGPDPLPNGAAPGHYGDEGFAPSAYLFQNGYPPPDRPGTAPGFTIGPPYVTDLPQPVPPSNNIPTQHYEAYNPSRDTLPRAESPPPLPGMKDPNQADQTVAPTQDTATHATPPLADDGFRPVRESDTDFIGMVTLQQARVSSGPDEPEQPRPSFTSDTTASRYSQAESRAGNSMLWNDHPDPPLGQQAPPNADILAPKPYQPQPSSGLVQKPPSSPGSVLPPAHEQPQPQEAQNGPSLTSPPPFRPHPDLSDPSGLPPQTPPQPRHFQPLPDPLSQPRNQGPPPPLPTLPHHDDYYEASNPRLHTQPSRPMPPPVQITAVSSYDEIPPGPRSPAESERSTFTSISQRGINPHWHPPPPHPGRGPPSGPYGLAPPPPRAPKRMDASELLFASNPDFELPNLRNSPPRKGTRMIPGSAYPAI